MTDSEPGRLARWGLDIQRSRAFWLGLPVMLFILWSWADCARHRRVERFLVHTSIVDLEVRDSLVSVSSFQFVNGRDYGPLQRQSLGGPASPSGFRLFSALRFSDYTSPAMRLRTLGVPHWLLALVGLAVWLPLLVWRRRRYRRLLSATAACPVAE